MPQCCYNDPLTVFTYDVEDGAPLAAYFVDAAGNPGTTDVTVVAGHGINSSNALHSAHTGYTGLYAECSVQFDSLLDTCGKPRQEFAVGGYWNFINPSDSSGFFFIEIRNTNCPLETLLSVYRIGQDLVVYRNYSSTVEYRIYNCFTIGTYQKVEIRGKVNAMDSARNASADGWIEARINGIVYPTGTDVSQFDPNAPPPRCPVETAGITWRDDFIAGDVGTWDKVTFGPQGDLDCPYIKEVAAYCDDNEVFNRPGAKCDPAGPGGSSFDGSAEGPRIIHPGGFTATYSAPTGGGVPATASDPAEPQSLVDAATVLVSLDITLCDSTVFSVGQAPIVAAGRAFCQPLVTHFGTVEYPLSDRDGNFKGQVWDVDIADPSGVLRGYLDSATNRFYTRWEGHLYAETDVARLAGTARRSLARGRCVSVTTPEDLIVRVTFADELTRQDSSTTLDREIPRFTIGEVFHGAGTTATGMQFLSMSVPIDDKDAVAQPPEHLLDQALPLLYGECSDDWREAENPPIGAVGICKAYLLGDVLLKSGSEVWQCYLASQYALKDINANGIFGSNLNSECPGSVRLDMDALAGSFLIPGHGNWSSYFATNYTDFLWGPQTYRCMVFYARGPISRQHVDGIVPISFNCLGIETVGDCSGTMIDDIPYIAQHYLDHPIIQQTLTGNWNAVATFADGVAKLRTTTFAAVKAIHDARISTRYRGRLIIDKKRSGKDWLSEILVAGNMRAGINHHGQVVVTTLDDAQSLASLTTYTDQAHIQDGSFKVTSERSADLENSVRYDWGPEPATGRLTGAAAVLTDGPSQTNWGLAKAEDLHYVATGRQNVADDVTGRRIIQTRDGITSGDVTIDLAGTALVGGQVIRLTDFRGLGASGWTNRLLCVAGRVLNPNVSHPPQPDDLTMTVHWEDVQRMLAAPSGAVGGGVTSDGSTTRAVGFSPVGTTAGGNGWTVGDTASGNGWRVG
jgi:hypothetical protein